MLYRRIVLFAMATLGVAVAAGCSEKIEAGAGCPQLCPSNQIVLADTVIDAVTVDTSVTGFPSIGNENYLVLASRGDTLDTRVIVRFDTLPATYRLASSTADSTIRMVDSATMRLTVDTLHGRTKVPVTVEAYDMGDTTVADTVTAALLPLFSPDRLLGSRTFAPESLVDTVRIPVSNLAVLNKVSRGQPLRIGLRLRSTQSATLRFHSVNLGAGASLRFRVSQDTSVGAITVQPNSKTPKNSIQSFLQTALEDYVIVAKGPPPPPPQVMAVGGIPGARAYLRFTIPSRIIDSARVIRASLVLTQVANARSPEAGDSLFLQPLPILAGPAIKDIATALTFAAAPGSYGLDSTYTTAKAGGQRQIQIVFLAQRWADLDTAKTPRALALRSNMEGIKGSQVLFFTNAAPEPLRPKLHLTYVPHVTFGLP